MPSHPLLRFPARTQTGAARGRELGFPTINFRLEDIPAELMEGIYACRVTIGKTVYDGALHYGPRPAVQDDVACEVHLLDVVLPVLPQKVEITIIARIRDVMDFPSTQALVAQIADDVDKTRQILAEHR